MPAASGIDQSSPCVPTKRTVSGQQRSRRSIYAIALLVGLATGLSGIGNAAWSDASFDEEKILSDVLSDETPYKHFDQTDIEIIVGTLFAPSETDHPIGRLVKWDSGIRIGVGGSALDDEALFDEVNNAIRINYGIFSRFAHPVEVVETDFNVALVFEDNIFDAALGKYRDIFKSIVTAEDKDRYLERIVNNFKEEDATSFSYVKTNTEYRIVAAITFISTQQSLGNILKSFSGEALHSFGFLGTNKSEHSIFDPEYPGVFPGADDVRTISMLYQLPLEPGMSRQEFREALSVQLQRQE